jgi:hypothetical protein
MSKTKHIKYGPISASPVKSFFVSMLTRDIQLEDAILDLLDNCVDGILRSKRKDGNRPYEGFWANIEVNKDSFTISDNCGGIPWSLHDYAFRMGRDINRLPDAPGSVGVYGIGMKRAIFKIGKHCLISSRNGKDQYEIEITPEWLGKEDDWNLSVNRARISMKEDGTTIIVGDLNPGITEQFGEDSEKFKSDLIRMISTHYAYIIDKGLNVKVNDITIESRTAKIIFNRRIDETPAIRPYIFKTTTKDDVEIFLTVGFYRPIPLESEILDALEAKGYSSEDAGWTVLCNDRAVLYCDRSELTGWGQANVPRYHTQFIGISGIVEFKADDPRKLPTTTTKRGLDASSPLYLQVKNKMLEGMRIFTDYTNKWKGREEEGRKPIQEGVLRSLVEIKEEAQHLTLNPTTKSFPPGDQYMPKLPLPPRLEPTKRRISFVKERTKIETVAEFLGDSDMRPSDVGEKCFDMVYDEARK